MDINEAALKLKMIELVQDQIDHLQEEVRNSSTYSYAVDCTSKAERLITLLVNSLNTPYEKDKSTEK